MNVNLLETLLHLFATLAREDGISEEDRIVVKNFLSQQFNESIAVQYLQVFDRYAEEPTLPDIKKLCVSVNNQLTYEQKLYILIRLIELAYTDECISLLEVKNIILVAKYLNIEYKEYQNIFNYITTKKPTSFNIRNLLIIGGAEQHVAEEEEFIHSENLIGYIAVLLVPSANIYLARYVGNSNLYLNGQNMLPYMVYFVNPGSVIRGPRIEPIYYSDIVDRYLHSSRTQRVSFEVQQVYFQFPNGKMGLHNVNLFEESGKMVAFMGASGAGKSTLLNVLNGNYSPTSGAVKINGVDVHRDSRGIEGLIGYVSQDDLLIEELTVYQNLFYNAQLCFGDLSHSQLHELVIETLSELSLLEIKDLRVGDPLNARISGGQRKRLNIALELIREPLVLFVDEPTSGLSSQDSVNVMDLLKVLANKGKLVMVVIHQPSSEIFMLFDRVYILDTGGYPVYYGNPLEAIRYFRRAVNHVNSEYVECQECGAVNPEQIFSILEARIIDEQGNLTNERKLKPTEWNELFHQQHVPRPQVAKTTRPEVHIHRPTRIKQFLVFMRRDIQSKLSNIPYLLVSLLEAPVLAFLLAFLLRSTSLEAATYSLYDNENLPAYIFVCILVAMFVGLTVSAEEILRDRRIRKRESFLHLSRHSYLMAKITVLFILSAIQMATFVLIGHWMIGLQELHFDYWLLLFTVSCFANILGLNVSATFDSAVTIYIIVPLLLIPQIILSGALVNYQKLHPSISNVEVVPAVGDLMTTRWGYEALMVRQFARNSYQQHFFNLDIVRETAQYKSLYWLEELRTWESEASNHMRVAADSPMVKLHLANLRRELEDEFDRLAISSADTLLDSLTYQHFTPSVDEKISELLNRLRTVYNRQIREVEHRKQEITQALRAQLQDRGQTLVAFREQYDNRRLTDVVTNQQTIDPFVLTSRGLVRLADPIYQIPQPDSFWDYRAHLYAPRKHVAGRMIDTFWFNILFIWVYCTLLYVALYFEFFRKLFTGVRQIRDRLNYRYRRRKLQRVLRQQQQEEADSPTVAAE